MIGALERAATIMTYIICILGGKIVEAWGMREKEKAAEVKPDNTKEMVKVEQIN